MREGDVWELFVPPRLGYGRSGQGAKIPGNAVLIFRLELLEVKTSMVPGQRDFKRFEPLPSSGPSKKKKKTAKVEL